MPNPNDDGLAIAKAAIHANPFKDALYSGKVAVSIAAFTSANYSIGQIAANAGFQAVMVDMEHSMVGFEKAAEIFAGALSAGVTPLVRVPVPTAEWVSRALDGGALGVSIPHVQCAEDAKNAVKYAKFSPEGERSISYGMPIFHSRPVPIRAATEVANDATVIICMIETAEAVEKAEEIAAVPGVTVLHIGTNDMCDSLGIPGEYDNPILHEKIHKVAAAAKKAWKDGRKVFAGVGAMQGRPDLLAKILSEDKHDVIRYFGSADYSLYANAMNACAQMHNGLLAKIGKA